MALTLDDTARWLSDAAEHGVSCFLVEAQRALGRHWTFGDACAKTVLQFDNRSLSLKQGFDVQLKEIKSVSLHKKRPLSPVFRTASDGIAPRLATIRWDKTGVQCQAGQYAHLVFSTKADANAFHDGMNAVQRFGFETVLSGSYGGWREGEAAPSPWQVDRARERFQAMIRGWRGRAYGEITAASQDTPAGDDIATETTDEIGDIQLDPFFGGMERAEWHIRWQEAVNERGKATDLPAQELRELVFGGIPLMHRHTLWKDWIGGLDLADLGEMEAKASEKDVKQIALDVPRTHSSFVDDRIRGKLSRVLSAFVGMDRATGYCQGMNFIVLVFVVLGFSEPLALAGLNHFVHVICDGYYSAGLEGYLRDISVLDALVHHLLPSLHAQLEHLEIPLKSLALDHFITLSSRVWPIRSVARLWDVLLSEGPSALIASFVALLEIYFPRATGVPLFPQNGAKPLSGVCSRDSQRVNAAVVAQQLPEDMAEVMDRFKKLVKRGGTTEIDEIMRHTRKWLVAITPDVVTRIRAEMVEIGEDGN
eukprot:TRINITY_DN9709_c0_g1_i1.p1 TRINITY_DN9709_c0_g1~~TRINITY_DN9709_c0_g1_i1.p1  ORF type:complete len:553 (+),score=90.69 TRINITY_DN9709_c0_g1_i1:54-1661(+)